MPNFQRSQVEKLIGKGSQAAGMVVHPSPGHYTGTLVNALLHHCQLPAMQVVIGNALPNNTLSSPGQSQDLAQLSIAC